jgi:hypothetical protein
MDEPRDILLNYSIKKYFTKDIDIDYDISKKYQCEIMFKYLKNIIYYNLTSKFEFKMYRYSNNEYKLNIVDIKDAIKNIYKLTDFEIIFFENLIQEKGIFFPDTSWHKNENYLWFKNISLKFYEYGSTLYTCIEFELNIDLMIELLKMRNIVIRLQRKYIDKLYNPKYGKFIKRDYLGKIIKFT